MALTKCEECGQVISDKANACPRCGAPAGVNNTSEKIGMETLLTNTNYSDSENPYSKSKHKPIFIVCFFIILLATYLFYFFNANDFTHINYWAGMWTSKFWWGQTYIEYHSTVFVEVFVGIILMCIYSFLYALNKSHTIKNFLWIIGAFITSCAIGTLMYFTEPNMLDEAYEKTIHRYSTIEKVKCNIGNAKFVASKDLENDNVEIWFSDTGETARIISNGKIYDDCEYKVRNLTVEQNNEWYKTYIVLEFECGMLRLDPENGGNILYIPKKLSTKYYATPQLSFKSITEGVQAGAYEAAHNAINNINSTVKVGYGEPIRLREYRDGLSVDVNYGVLYKD